MAHDAQINKTYKGWKISAAAYLWEARKGLKYISKVYADEACSLTRLQQAKIHIDGLQK